MSGVERARVMGWVGTRWRMGFLLVALLLVIVCLFNPRLMLPGKVYRFIWVLDITQSMNAQDYHVAGMPSDRLNFATESMRRLLHELPCGSEVGLGLFTTKSAQLLFNPIEVCDHFAAIDAALSHLDWRMAWSADSHVETGLYHALREVRKQAVDTRLIFFTDGQETPPQTVKPQFDGRIGETHGVIVGVGGVQPVRVPRYDRENHLIGYWENGDIDRPPVSTTVYSEKVETHTLPREGPYLSWLDEAHLRGLAATTGLGYRRLASQDSLPEGLLVDELAEIRPADTDIRPYLGLVALLLVLMVTGFEGRQRLRDGK